MPVRRRGETGSGTRAMAYRSPCGEADAALMDDAARERRARRDATNLLQYHTPSSEISTNRRIVAEPRRSHHVCPWTKSKERHVSAFDGGAPAAAAAFGAGELQPSTPAVPVPGTSSPGSRGLRLRRLHEHQRERPQPRTLKHAATAQTPTRASPHSGHAAPGARPLRA